MPLAATPYPAADVAAAVARGLAAASDLPQPVADAGRTPEKYARLARDFRAGNWRRHPRRGVPEKYARLARDFRISARLHLDRGDLPQASNKAWALVDETVKAVSAQHGGIIHSHGAIWTTVRELAQLAGNAGDAATEQWLRNSFTVARGLHSNFYQDEAPLEDVSADLCLCEQLAERLLALFGTA